MRIYTCAEKHLRGNTTTAKKLLGGKTPAGIYKPRGKTSARIYKPRGFTPTAEKQRCILAFTPRKHTYVVNTDKMLTAKRFIIISRYNMTGLV